MIWPPEVIAHAVLDAGMTGEQAVTAIAVALAATGGDDAWRSDTQIAGGPAWWGAWALPVDDDRPPKRRNETELGYQARILAERVGKPPGDWSWSVIYRTGTYLAHTHDAQWALDHATGVVTGSNVERIGQLFDSVTREVAASDYDPADLDSILRRPDLR